MSQELQHIDIPDSNIEFTVSEIKYDFSELLANARKLHSELSTVTVTEETVKSNKKLVAELNKVTNKLHDEKMLVKRELLAPFYLLENDLKEIIDIVKEADEHIRSQIKELTEQERIHKQNKIEDLFIKRQNLYELDDYVSFTEFLLPAHLNKSVTIKSIEQDIVDYFEKVSSDIKTIDVLDNKQEVLQTYLETKDVGIAIQLAKQRAGQAIHVESIINKANKTNSTTEHQTPLEKVYTFKIRGKKDYTFVKLLLEENDIEFEEGREFRPLNYR